MEQQRYFDNPYDDYNGQPVEVNENYVRNLIRAYVNQIAESTQSGDSRGDLYVGDAGSIFKFYQSRTIKLFLLWTHFIVYFNRYCIHVFGRIFVFACVAKRNVEVKKTRIKRKKKKTKIEKYMNKNTVVKDLHE